MTYPYYILDTETASLRGGVVEIAWLKITEQLEIEEQYVCRVNPECPIEPGAQAIHGISDDDVKDCPIISEVTALLPKPLVIVAHNVAFDARVLGSNIAVAGTLCTLSLSRQYVKGTTNHKLSTLQTELGLSVQDSHSALGDVLTVLDLLRHIIPLTGRSLDQLISVQSKPKVLHRFPFGKHRGELIVNTPKDYRDWFLKQESIDPDLRYTLELLNKVS